MKIAMVTKYYNKYQGIPRVVAELSESLSEKHEVHIYAWEWDHDGSFDIRFHKVPQVKSPTWLPYQINELLFFFYSGLCLRFNRFDIVNIHDACFYSKGIFTCHAFPMGSIRIIKNLVSIPFKMQLHYFLPVILLSPLSNFNIKSRGTRKIIAVSQFIKNTLVKYTNRGESDISVVHNGVDLDRFNPDRKEDARRKIREQHQINENDFVISFVGYYLDRKGLSIVLDTLPLLEDKSIKVLVVGQDVDDYPLMAEQIARHGLETRIVPAGPVKNVEDYIGASDLLVLPALYEPFGNVVLEAMACAVPVIASRQTGASELIIDGETGFVLSDVFDTQEFADKIRCLINDSRLSEEMGRRSFEIARNHSWNTVVGETLKVFEEAYSTGPGESLTARK